MIRRSASILFLSIAVTAAAQQPRTLKETIEVQVTNLDVVVTDAAGNHVSGLTKDDFEVVENGRSRPITNLSEYRRDSTSPGQPLPRRILVAIDNRTIAFSARKKTVAAVRAKVDELLADPDDRLMIVTISGSAKKRTGWTADRAEINAALDVIEKDAAASRLDTAELDNMFGEMIHVASGQGPTASTLNRRRQRTSSGGAQADPRRAADEDDRIAPGVDYNRILSRTRSYAASVAAETEQTLYSLAASLNQFGGLSDGRRLVLLAGGSLPVFPGAEVFQRLESALRDIERHANNQNSLAPARRISSTMMEKASFDLANQIDDVAAVARLKGIAFYAVNPEGNERPSKDISSRYVSGAGTDFAAAATAADGFQRLALATGGESHVGRTAELAVQKVQDDLDSFYSLGYSPGTLLTPDTKIVVKTKAGHRARAIIAAAQTHPEWQIADRVVNNHAHPEQKNDLGISLVADRSKVEGDARHVKVNVMIPFDGLRLVRDGGEYNCSFTVFVSVGDANGGANPQRETRNFRWNAETVEKLRGKKIAYGLDLTLGPGRDRVSVGILDLVSGTTGYSSTTLAQ